MARIPNQAAPPSTQDVGSALECLAPTKVPGAGRDPPLNVSSMASHRVTTTEAGDEWGLDMGQNLRGRTQHMLGEGTRRRLVVHRARRPERDGADDVLERLPPPACQAWRPSGLTRNTIAMSRMPYTNILDIVEEPVGQDGIVVVP